MNRSIILASASPRRKQLLESAGIVATVEVADIDESHGDGEKAADYVARMAYQKAEAVVRRHLSDKSTDKSVGLDVVVAADTIVVVDGVILGKPASRDEAFSMLKRLVSRRHDVMTAVAIADLAGRAPKWQRFVVTTHVEFGDVDDARLWAYIDSGEPMDKAGAYGIQSGAASFVRCIEGSYTNVVGLPLYETVSALADYTCAK
ncbi:MAG: septum formation protein Maf [Bradymonadales bacterium]|nr:septum formation protein Maf [Bradymonadales bacterium]